MSDNWQCTPYSDWFGGLATKLNIGLCFGVVVSFLPQHYRIIHAKTSEGFSLIFLLLGTTSTATGMFNVMTLPTQTPILRCCRVVGFRTCLETNAVVIQSGLQWLCFTLVFVLYMAYYPQHLKYIDVDADEHEPSEEVAQPLLPQPSPILRLRSVEWRSSLIAFWIAAVHFSFIAITTVYLLLTTPPSHPENLTAWSTVLGITAALLASIQFVPQLVHTYQSKLVGALSIPMMAIQVPGGLFIVASAILRPGADWTGWVPYVVASVLQGCLLILCIIWRARQRKLGIDDFGNPVLPPIPLL